MNKDEYILRSLSKIKHKKWELFIISRIIHQLNDFSVEFICQQLIRKQDGTIALVDLFFPQFDTYLEIDEQQHAHSEHRLADARRSQSIFEVTGFTEKRIAVFNECGDLTLSEVSKEVDCFVSDLITQKNNQGSSFVNWDFENQFCPEPHIERGYINLTSKAVFRTHRDALRCFGYVKGNYQRGSWRLPYDDKKMVWFPKLYRNQGWDNMLVDLKTIKEFKNENHAEHLERVLNIPRMRITFAHETNTLGQTLYRYKGVFELDEDATSQSGVIYRKVDDEVRLPKTS